MDINEVLKVLMLTQLGTNTNNILGLSILSKLFFFLML